MRNLVILNINDQLDAGFRSGEGAAKHFEVYDISTWAQVQLILSGRDSISAPDLLLLDISFDKDSDLEGAVMPGAGASIDQPVPVGPVLALPFLNSKPVMGFAPYSAHIKKNDLKQYPPFLVPMGLIAAKMSSGIFSSRYLSPDNSDGSLDNFINGLQAAGNAALGLQVALTGKSSDGSDGYRANLKAAVKAGRIMVLNSEDLVSTFERLEETLAFDTPTKDGDVFIEMPADAYLDMIDDQGNKDRIRLISLFADQVNWTGKYIEGKGISIILGWLSDLEGTDPIFQKALRVVERQEEALELTDERPRTDVVIRELYFSLSDPDRREILRLCVLFANVHAWSIQKSLKLVKEDVYQKLGLKKGKGQNTYLDWFGADRSTKRIVKDEVCGDTIIITRLSPLNEALPEGSIDRFFLGKSSIVSEADDVLISRYRRLFAEREGYDLRWNKPYTVPEIE